jgi:hypothetical protein
MTKELEENLSKSNKEKLDKMINKRLKTAGKSEEQLTKKEKDDLVNECLAMILDGEEWKEGTKNVSKPLSFSVIIALTAVMIGGLVVTIKSVENKPIDEQLRKLRKCK